jgi:ATP-binding cassette subfamily B protein
VKRFLETVQAVSQMAQIAWQVHPWSLIFLIVLQTAQAVVPVLAALVTKNIFDLLSVSFTTTNTPQFLEDLLFLLFIQTSLLIMLQALQPVTNHVSSNLQRELTLTSQVNLYKILIDLDDLALFESPEFHDTLRLASQGIRNGPSQVLVTFINLFKSFINLITFIGVLLIFSPLLSIILMMACLPQLYSQLKMSRQRLNLVRANSPKDRQLFYLSNIFSSAHHIKEIYLFNIGKYFINKFVGISHEVNLSQRKQQLREMWTHLSLAVLTSSTNSIAFIVVVAQAYLRNITLGDVTLYLSAITNIQSTLSNIITNFAILHENALFFSYYRKLMILSYQQVDTAYSPDLAPLREGIDIQNVSFRYTEHQEWILKDLNLHIPKGKCVALVGTNGAGKSTLVKLLTRLYNPIDGQITWDGVNIKIFDAQKLRQYIGVIFQDFVQYEQTVRENIGIGNINEVNNLILIQQAAMKTGAHEFINKLKNNYNTILSRWLADEGEGIELSGGQWQKVALARLFMRDADFLILDEPTSSLDISSEYEVYQNFATLAKGKTSLLISHRFSTVRMADLIAVLEDGKIVEYGTHQQLMLNGNTYAKLYTMQVEQYASPPKVNQAELDLGK